MKLNAAKTKALTNMRAAGKDTKVRCSSCQSKSLLSQGLVSTIALLRVMVWKLASHWECLLLCSGPDADAVQIALDEPRIMSLDDALEYINEDELVEVRQARQASLLLNGWELWVPYRVHH